MMRIAILLFLAQSLRGQSLTLSLTDPHPYRQGELVRAEIHLPDSQEWQFAGVLLDPPSSCGTLQNPCFLQASHFGGGVSYPRNLPHDLNSYLPQLAPGQYRVTALARKLVPIERNSAHSSYGYGTPSEYARSAPVFIQIIAADSAWVRQTIARCIGILTAPPTREANDAETRNDAAQQLSFLNDPAAWSADLALLPQDENVLLAGLGHGRPQARVCDLMQARIPAPTQSVSSSYLYRLSEICAEANLPPQPTPPAGAQRPGTVSAVISATPPAATPAAPDPKMQAWLEQRRAYIDNVLDSASSTLAASLPSKQTPAKWDAFATLLQRVDQLQTDRRPIPTWLPLLSAEFVRAFPSVETPRKQYLLDLYANTVNTPDLAPLLENVLDSWKPGDYYEAPHSAIRALARIAPDRAHARILAELTKEKTWLDEASLELLPPSDVPPMDDALIEALARDQRTGGWSPTLRMAAIARYATRRALPRIRAIFESQQNPCQPELAAYFVRVDPAYADRIFHAHPWDMHAAPPQCTAQYFHRVPPLAMGPPMERYLAAYLMHSDVHLKSTAATVLARYGTASALPALWDAFRYFHEYWKGKDAELEKLGEDVGLEVDLRNAIARGRGWLATDADLHLIESLCTSARCLDETRQDLQAWTPPMRIEIGTQPTGFYGRIAQYFGLDSAAALESKLAQFPAGARFVITAHGAAASHFESEIRRLAAEKGIFIAP